MSTAMLSRVIAAYTEVTRITNEHVAYVYGGGHNDHFAPDPGYDCSGLASRVLHVAGLLGSPRVAYPLDTEEFEVWGGEGPGEWLTVWVRDAPVQHHVFLEFTLPAPRSLMRFAQAATEGQPVGWLGPDGQPWRLPTLGFHPRHWPGT